MEAKGNGVSSSLSSISSLKEATAISFDSRVATPSFLSEKTLRPTDRPPLKVLIAEDNRDLRDIVVRMVKTLGHDVSIASTGKESLLQVHEQPPDIILLDIMMPEMTGFEFCQALQTEGTLGHFHIIIMSARDALEDKVKGLELGAADYLTKPFSLAELRARLQVGERIVRHRQSIKAQQEQLEHLAREDTLTGLSNRRHFDERLQEEWQRMLRYGHALSLLLCDIDHFKKVNDVYGHTQGDLVLKEIGKVLLRGSRASDVVARYGGEEFVILLCEATLEQAAFAAERLRVAVRELSFAHPSGSFHITMSVGVANATRSKLEDPVRLLAEADEALYAAKGLGRDRVVCFERRTGDAAL